MAGHTFTKINQKEYLKKYLSGDSAKKKKKDKKHKKSSSKSVRVKIIDDDINHLDTGPEIDEELLLTGDDAPQIVGEYIEQNPSDRNIPKWKSIVIKDEPEDAEENVWGKKASKISHSQQLDVGKKRSNRTPDNSPPRKNDRNRRSVSSSPHSRYHRSVSPPRKSKKDKSPQRFSRSKNDSAGGTTKIKTEPRSPQYERNNLSYTSPRLTRKISDQSPPRSSKNPFRNNQSHVSDQSPPRRRNNSDQSPPRKNKTLSIYHSPGRHRRNSDQSPPRKSKIRDQSPPRLRRNESPIRNHRKKSPFLSPNCPRRDSDQTPPRKHRTSDKSPPRNRKYSDLSPPRNDKRRNSEQFSSRKIRNSYEESPPRKNRSRPTPDNSPPRKARRSPDQSPPRRKKRSPGDLSPARIKREKRTPDLSPEPRRRSRWERQDSEKSLSPPPTHTPKPGKTLEGKKAGLQDAKALHKETALRRKQEEVLFEKMSTDVSGRNAEVRVRSTGRKGRRAREAAEEDPEERRRKEAQEEKKKQLYDRWGKGLKQIEDHKNRMLQQEHESNKPLARYSNDEDLELHLKEQERSEDPMLEYMRQKRKEKDKLSGKPELPRYEGAYPENRFGIRPGYRWDGVDRSNGYEKKYFAVRNERKARQDEAYKYSVEDM